MEKIADRQQQILDTIIREYIGTAEPVGSMNVQKKIKLDVSPATIRNDMASLEAEGYLISPHTSAGRIPTEQAYRYYVRNLLQQTDLSPDEVSLLRHVWRNEIEPEVRLKLTAKIIAELSAEGVFLAFGPHSLYYTGLSNLFSQPEFSTDAVRVSMASIIDHLDEKVGELLERLEDGVEVMVGSENPLGNDCSVIVARYTLQQGIPGIFGILGPTRMDYASNLTRVSYVHEIINTHE
jgi:heat-inducible transcriptional repressor